MITLKKSATPDAANDLYLSVDRVTGSRGGDALISVARAM
jgi:hypothetical protein